MVARMTFGASRWIGWMLVLAAALLSACASGPQRGATNSAGAVRASGDRDGAEVNPPSDLAKVPDAEPRLEAIRNGGPNKPYDVLGKNYVPITRDAPFTERGLASWYGKKFHGKRTASGEVYNMYAMTAAHPTLPIPSYARVRNPANGREVLVRINDRGPFHGGRIVDLSYTAALKLDLLRGVGQVELERITFDDIRTGAWRRDAPATQMAGGVGVPGALVASVSTAAPAPVLATANAGTTIANATVPAPAPAPAPAAASAAAADSVPSPAPAAETAVAASSAAITPASPPSLPAEVVRAAPNTPAATAPLADAPVARAFTTPARGFWVQLGAFRQRDGAESFQQRVGSELDWLSPLLAVFSDASLYRLQAGPYPSRSDASAAAERIRSALQLVPVIVERR
jgi:rare lipoprotein A